MTKEISFVSVENFPEWKSTGKVHLNSFFMSPLRIKPVTLMLKGELFKHSFANEQFA